MVMDTNWKRPKTIDSRTEHIETQCGTLHLTLGFEEGSIIEIRPQIGKSGTCGNVQLDTIGKLLSMYLQSPEPRYKIIKKLKKQFEGMNCGQPFKWNNKDYAGCHDIIIKSVIKELEKQIN